jgi:heme-degrading monooxygenase HmoA
MTELLTLPPPPDALAAMATIPGMTIQPGVLVAQRGPSSKAGPEGAGAVLMLQATFVDPDGAAAFWAAAVPLMQMLSDAPGMIRRYSFADGPSITLLAFWENLEDATAFASSPEHRTAVRGLYKNRWQYSHFSAVWSLASKHDRVVFCDQPECSGVTSASNGACDVCGTPFADPYI